jgi:hypothetical protein
MGEQTLRPLTVKQIKNCSTSQDNNFKIDNADVTQVSQSIRLHSLLFICYLDYLYWCYS